MSRPNRVLIVEDQEDTRDLYALCLEAAGWKVEAFGTGEELVFVAASFNPDVIVMDLCMPVVGGVEATRRLKANALTGHIPVVVVSAMDREMGEALATEAGCAEYVPKPCSPDDLHAILRHVVERQES